MRLTIVAFGVALSLAAFSLGAPHFLAAVVQWPGFQAIELAGRGEDLRAESFDRARRALSNARLFVEHRGIPTNIAVIEHNMGAQVDDPSVRDIFYKQSMAAAFDSLTLSPVQPLAWLLVAQIQYEREDFVAAAEAFDWALHTSHYMRHQARARALLSLSLWDLIEEETRAKSMDAILDAMEREIDLVASIAAAGGVQGDLRQRLQAEDEDGVLLAARFDAAVRRYRHNERLRLAALEEFTAMRQALIATSMFVTTSLPTFAEAMSVHEYMEIRSGDHPTRSSDSADEYLSAVLDGLLVLGFFNREEGVAIFCVPDRHVLDINVPEFRANLDSMLEQFATDMPNFNALARTRSVGLVSLEVLSVMYPCEN